MTVAIERRRWPLAGLAALVAGSLSARASPPPLSVQVSPEQAAAGSVVSTGLLEGLERSDFLLGDMFGLRTALSRYGISIALQETSEVLGNVTGGVHRGAAYDGLTQAILQLDTQRAFGFYGGLFNVSALQIHGRNLSADNLASLQTSSGIEADRATRLWELWYDQKFLAEDRFDIRIGLQSADQEFINNQNGAYFVNTMFGWPVVPSYDMPGGGPAYPLSAPAVRFRYRPINALAILVGVFNGSPADTNNGDAQQVNATGASFPINRGPLVLMELQYTYPALGGMEEPGAGAPLGYTYKLGAWYNREHFDDLRYDTTGIPLASPNSTGLPLQHAGDFSIYALADQMVWRAANNPNRSVSVFGRAMGTPQSDRNLINASFNGGVVFHSPFISRPDDTAGLGLGYAHVSGGQAGADRDAILYNTLGGQAGYLPVQSSETFIEATYQYQARPWWQIQPDAQYVFRPGASTADPNTGARVRNELVLGLRTNILF
jgi:porin